MTCIYVIGSKSVTQVQKENAWKSLGVLCISILIDIFVNMHI